MKRNLDTIRHTLLVTETFDISELRVNDYVTEKYSFNEISYHIALLTDDGYIIATPIEYIGVTYPDYFIKRLTNKGCDFLDSIRSETVFNKTKNKIISTVGATTLDLVKDVAMAIAKGLLGI